MELLSPAGNYESLKAAITAGADAVYIGGYKFSARAFSKNFTNEEIKDAVMYAHLRDVKIYVAANTVISENEVDEFISFIKYLYEINVDAVIMQDLGMIDLVHKLFPDLEIHASTQAHITNLDAVLFLESLGVKRCVLARELSIDEIKYIKKNSRMELEIFIHGSLCMSYSGLCLMSSLIGGRSGNKGSCAGPCRKKYEDNYYLSTKDLGLLEDIIILKEIGIESVKIEGRMKRVEYVYEVTNLYRKIIDNQKFDLVELLDRVKRLFNREFTKGFISGVDSIKNEDKPNHMGVILGKVINYGENSFDIKLERSLSINDGIRINENNIGFVVTSMYKSNKAVKEAVKNDIVTIKKPGVKKCAEVYLTTDSKQLKEIQEILKTEKRVPINMELKISDNNTLELITTYKTIKVTSTCEYTPEIPKNIITSNEIINKQLNKLKDTPFYLDNLNINFSEDYFIDIKVINSLRRQAVSELIDEIIKPKKVRYGKYNIEVPDFLEKNNTNCYVRSDTYLDLGAYNNIYSNIVEGSIKVYEVVNNNYTNHLALIKEIGGINKLDTFITDYTFNVFNSYTLALLHSRGAQIVNLSLELSIDEIKEIITNYKERFNKNPNTEVVVQGKIPAMITKEKFDSDDFKDAYNNTYEIERQSDSSYIYHFEKLQKNAKDYFAIGVFNVRIDL